MRHVDNGFGLVAASACTLSRTRSGRGSHHPYFCREGSHDNLIEDFTVEGRTTPAARRSTGCTASTSEGLSSPQRLVTRCDGEGTFDSHGGMPFAKSAPGSPSTTTAPRRRRARGPTVRGPFHPLEHTVTNGRAGLVRLDGLAPYSATVGVSEVPNSARSTSPDFPGTCTARLALYGRPAPYARGTCTRRSASCRTEASRVFAPSRPPCRPTVRHACPAPCPPSPSAAAPSRPSPAVPRARGAERPVHFGKTRKPIQAAG